MGEHGALPCHSRGGCSCGRSEFPPTNRREGRFHAPSRAAQRGGISFRARERARARAIPFEELAAAARVQGSILSFAYSKSPRDGRAKHAREAEVKVSPFSLLPSGEVSFVFAFGEDSRRILWPRKIARRGNLEIPPSFSLFSRILCVFRISYPALLRVPSGSSALILASLTRCHRYNALRSDDPPSVTAFIHAIGFTSRACASR